MEDRNSLLQKAINYAFLLLKFRLRSELELRRRLENKKFDESTISQAVGFLKEKKFIDDNVFAEIWVNSRLKKPFGLSRIRRELALKGIAKPVIEGVIGKIKSDYPEEAVVLDLAKKRISKSSGLDSQKVKRRVYGYLLRRGFSSQISMDVLNKLLE